MYFSWVSIWDRNISWIQKEKKAAYSKINRGSKMLPEELGGWKRGKWTAVDIVLSYGDKTSRDFSACVVDGMWCTAADKESNDKLLFRSRSGRKSDNSGSPINWKELRIRVVLVWHKSCVSKWVRSLLQHSVPVLRALISEFEEQSESNWKTEKKNGQILPFFFFSHFITVDWWLMAPKWSLSSLLRAYKNLLLIKTQIPPSPRAIEVVILSFFQ